MVSHVRTVLVAILVLVAGTVSPPVASAQTSNPPFSASTTSGPVGSTVAVSGTGCTARNEVTVWLQNGSPAGYTRYPTSAGGAWSGTFVVPSTLLAGGSVTPGEYGLFAACGSGLAGSAFFYESKDFTVTDATCTSVRREVPAGGPQRVVVTLPAGEAVVTFRDVSPAGAFTIEECEDAELSAGIFARYDLSSTFSFGSAEVCLPYDEDAARRAGLRESEIDLIHDGDDGQRVVTTRRDADANFVCGQVSSFSPFFLGAGALVRSIDLACPPGRVPASGFVDVPAASTHAAAIECLVWWDITRGLDAGGTRYGPRQPVSRGQMATFMVRTIERSGGSLPAASRDWFTDDDGSVHEDAIDRLRQARVISGTSATSFAPGRPVTRGQMATFLRNTLELRTGVGLGSRIDYFSDDEGNTHEDAINAVAAAGLARGTDGLTAYAPAAHTTRAQMATFITRMLDLLVEQQDSQPPA